MWRAGTFTGAVLHRLKLHPVVVLFGLVFWNMLWGILGALLSVPIMSAGKIVLLNIKHPTAQWMAAVLEGDMMHESRQTIRAQEGGMAPRRQP